MKNRLLLLVWGILMVLHTDSDAKARRLTFENNTSHQAAFEVAFDDEEWDHCEEQTITLEPHTHGLIDVACTTLLKYIHVDIADTQGIKRLVYSHQDLPGYRTYTLDVVDDGYSYQLESKGNFSDKAPSDKGVVSVLLPALLIEQE